MVNTSIDTTQGSISKQILRFFFPVLFGFAFQQLYNTTDAIIVGNFIGKEALAAVGGTTGSILNLFVGFFIGISSGFSVSISQYFGSKNQKDLQESIHTAVAFSIISGIVISIVGFFLSEHLLRFMKIPESVFPFAKIYLKIIFIGMIFTMIYNMGASILRAVGDSRTPLMFLIISCFINILLDLLFIIVFRWSVFGVAFATLISQAISMILVLIKLSSTSDIYKLYFNKIKINKLYFKKMFNLGLAAGLQSVMFTSANVVIQSSINTLGVNASAASSISSKIDAIFWISVQSLGISISTVAGQNYGARNKKRVKDTLIISLIICFFISLSCCFILLTFGEFLLSLFNKDIDVINNGMKILRIMGLGSFAFIIVEVYASILRAASDVWIPMIITSLSVCLTRILWIFVIFPKMPALEVIMYSYPISWVCTSILFLIYLHKYSKLNKWLKS